jgi:hypothetical protein
LFSESPDFPAKIRRMPEQRKPDSRWSLSFLFGALTALLLSVKIQKPTPKSPSGVTPKADADQENNRPSHLSLLSAKLPPTPGDAGNTCQCCHHCHHKTPQRKRIIGILTLVTSILTLVVLSIYACDTHRIWKEMKQQSETSQKTYLALGRPYVGVDSFTFTPIVNAATPNIRTVNITAIIKNFGAVPSLNYSATIIGFIGGVRKRSQQTSAYLPFMFPGKQNIIFLHIDGKDASESVIMGKITLAYDLTIRYSGPDEQTQKYEYCDRYYYDPNAYTGSPNAFSTRGGGCGEK